MAKNRLVHFGTILLVCVLVGSLIGFVFVEISQFVRDHILALPQLREDWAAVLHSLEPYLSRTLTGAVFIGLTTFFICRMALTDFARDLLEELAGMLRQRKLLPFTFHFDKKESLGNLRENLSFLFDSYVKQLHESVTDKARYEEALSKYADPTVAGALKNQTSEGSIKSGRRRVAILFADIRGFTPMTETLLPEEVVMILNEHFSDAHQAVAKFNGKVNKYIGDAIMAIFEEPPAYKVGESASRNAVAAALEMCRKFEENYPVWASRIHRPVTFGLGVGVHAGEAILGNIGSTERMEYTAIGDTVNLSSRLCSLAKPGQVIISQDCYEEDRASFDAEAQEPKPIKGKSGLYQTYLVRRVLSREV
jgi:class 3 adenylate cyclase